MLVCYYSVKYNHGNSIISCLVSRFVKYTGYGNAAGLLAARGLLRGSRDSGIYSEDEDSETEEYKEAKAQLVSTQHCD